jgi:hypothetical protein
MRERLMGRGCHVYEERGQRDGGGRGRAVEQGSKIYRGTSNVDMGVSE